VSDMEEFLNINEQNIITILENEEEYFDNFVKKHGLIWRTEDKNNKMLPLSKAYVGYIVTPKRKINLSPKYKEIGFEHIFRMYLYVYGYKSTDGPGVLDVSDTQNDIDVAELFFSSLQRNISIGIIQTYDKQNVVSASIRGNVNFTSTFINHKKGIRKPVKSTISKLSLDNSFNRLIVSALTKLRYVQNYTSLSSKFLMYFENVPDMVKNGSALLESVNFNPNTSRYRQTLLYAAMIIDELDYDDIGNSVGTESFIINFDRLFEDFVSKVLIEIPKQREFITWSHSKKYGEVLSNEIKVDSREYQPDILYRFKNEDEKFDYLPTAFAVLDVKNKAYGTFKNADVYQILAYARLLKSEKIVLLYPSFSKKIPEELALNPEIFNPSTVTACFINIADNSGEKFLESVLFFVDTVERTLLDISIK